MFFCKFLSVPFFFSPDFGDHRHLLSFPTRRSSDLVADVGVAQLIERDILRLPALGFWRRFVVRFRPGLHEGGQKRTTDRKSTRLNSSHTVTSYAVFCLKKKSGNGRSPFRAIRRDRA